MIGPDGNTEPMPLELREEVRRLAADPGDRAELAVLCDELDELTPAWPAD